MKKPSGMKMRFMKIQWHILVIAAVILALSIISWVQFAGKAGSLISDRSSEKKEEALLPGSAEKPAAASKKAADTGVAADTGAGDASEANASAAGNASARVSEAGTTTVAVSTAEKTAAAPTVNTAAADSVAADIPAANASAAAVTSKTSAEVTDTEDAGTSTGKEASPSLGFKVERKLAALKRKAAALCSSVDKVIDSVGSKWSVYNKKEFSSIDTRLTYFSTGEISSVQVLSGKNKWLFYKTKTDGDPIGDYEGTNIQTPQEMEKIAKTALSAQKRLADRGTELVILAAPNKEGIYWENMPETYVHAERTRTDILVDYLLNKGINIVSPKKDLLDAHLSTQLYYCYDTHWNQLGAYIAVRDTLAPWGISMPELSERTVTSKPLHGNYHYNAQDDLSKMVGLREILTDETEYEVDGTVPMEWGPYEREQSLKEVSHFSNDKALNKASVLLVGDSFRSAMIPALREQFADVYVTLRADYKPEILDEIHPDYLIAEYAERYTKSIGNINFLLE